MNELVDAIFDAIMAAVGEPRLAVLLLAVLPVSEARLAVPAALKFGLSPLEAFFYAFVGSSLVAPVLIACLIPLFDAMSKTRFFSGIGDRLKRMFALKAEKIGGSGIKRMIGVATFVAVPLPLTGVWSGSAVASLVGIGYARSLIAVLVGNLIASAIVTVSGTLLGEYINILAAGFMLLAVVAVGVTLIKLLRKKRENG